MAADWPDTYCPKTRTQEHSLYYVDHGGREVCACGATRGEAEAAFFGPEDASSPGTTTGAAHPETSHAAALRVLPVTGTQRAAVLDMLKAWSLFDSGGATDEEMQHSLEMPANSQRPRRQELVKLGWITDSGSTRKTESGAEAIVWRYVP